MISIYLVEPNERYPEYDYQEWSFLYWQGTAHPMGRRLGEWVWVGRTK